MGVISPISSIFSQFSMHKYTEWNCHCLRQRTFLFSRQKSSRQKSRCRKDADPTFSNSFQLSSFPLHLSSLTYFSTLPVFQPISKIEALLSLSVPATLFVPPSAEGALGHSGARRKKRQQDKTPEGQTQQVKFLGAKRKALVNYSSSWASLQICLWQTNKHRSLEEIRIGPHTERQPQDDRILSLKALI